MEYEIELKLLTNKDAGEIIEKKLLPQLDVSVTQRRLLLTNHYFDTPDKKLRQNDIGLRIRGFNQKYEQTLKTAGQSIGGLQRRPEYNVDLDESKQQSIKVPDLHLFPSSVWPKGFDVDDVQARLATLFTTHFQRNVYLLEYSSGDIVELVWDLGEVTSGDKSVPICEIELELKQGETKLLFDLAQSIVGLIPATIGTESKAARGYALLNGDSVNTIERFQQQPLSSVENSVQDYSRCVTAQLQAFQMFSVEIRRQFSGQLANHITHIVNELDVSLGKFMQHFPCDALGTILCKVKKLHDDWLLALQQNNKVETNVAVKSVLTRTQTTQLQLDIVQFLVEQPWSSKAVQ